MSERTSCEGLLFPDNDLCQGCFFWAALVPPFLAGSYAGSGIQRRLPHLAACCTDGTWAGSAPPSLCPVQATTTLTRRKEFVLSLSLSATLLHKLLSPSTTLEGATGAIITVWCQIRQASYCGRAHSQSLWRPESTDYIRPDD